MKPVVAALALLLLTLPALADATTYKGTIGKLPIVVEFANDVAHLGDTGFGRYFYVGKGIDIPLHVTAAQAGKLKLAEELPCEQDGSNCPNAGDDTPSNPPLGAVWALDYSGEGAELNGSFSWNGRSLPITLTKIGSRDDTPDNLSTASDLADATDSLIYDGGLLTAQSSPYDFAKMQEPVDVGAPMRIGKATYDYVTDPRTKFQYPRVIDIGGGDISIPNGYLEQRDWSMRLSALNCMAKVYQGMGWSDSVSWAAGTLGDYDSETVDVKYLSPTVMSWTEAGSLFCGGAHPYNHYEFFNLDMHTGMPLDLSRIFKGWVARDFDGNIVDLADARTHPQDLYWGPGQGPFRFRQSPPAERW